MEAQETIGVEANLGSEMKYPKAKVLQLPSNLYAVFVPCVVLDLEGDIVSWVGFFKTLMLTWPCHLEPPLLFDRRLVP